MASRPLLPVFHVRKSTFRTALNEKTLIAILILSSIFTLIVIFKNLPQNYVNDVQLKKIFIPELNNQKGRDFLKPGHNEENSDKQDDKNQNDAAGQVVQPNVDQPPASSDDPVNQMRRDKIRNMTLYAWNSYKKYAWGKNELRPISKTGHSPGIFGGGHDLGASIVDALDTLYIMGLYEQFNDGAKWVKDNFNIVIDADLSFFEVNIRFIGGFLAAYTLSKDKMFLDKAIEVADAFMPAFSTKTGYAFSIVNPVKKSSHNYNWAASQCSILSEFGTLSLEFQYLTDLTGNKIYQEKIEKIYESLDKANKREDLYYNYANPHTGSWCNSQASLAGLGDSFYEYLIKYWLYKDREDSKILGMYLKTMKAVRSKLVVSSGGHTFLGEYSGGSVQNKMGHLACFAGGMFALTSMQDAKYVEETEAYRKLAIDITDSCHESYIRTPSRIGPESFGFYNGREFDPIDTYYILRPEVIESYFYLWRMTKDPKYRDWAWDAAEAIEKHCRTDGGYTGFRDVRAPDTTQDDVQQSFFFAETLKYLYLIFSDDSVLPFDKYVFNTEAHPFLIRNSKK